jgi:hypothetical protein
VAVEDAEAAGHLLEFNAGNNTTDNDAVPIFTLHWEAPNVIAVAATSRAERLTNFSIFGAASVDLGAPGKNILGLGKRITANGSCLIAPRPIETIRSRSESSL